MPLVIVTRCNAGNDAAAEIQHAARDPARTVRREAANARKKTSPGLDPLISKAYVPFRVDAE